MTNHGAPVLSMPGAKFAFGDHVRKKSGAEWQGYVCGFYTTDITTIGYCIRIDSHYVSVQIYPESALETAT